MLHIFKYFTGRNFSATYRVSLDFNWFLYVRSGVNTTSGFIEELKCEADPAVGGNIGPKDNFDYFLY